jgi:hypothetical protein
MTRETFNTLGARLAAELLILAIFYVVLRQQDAPAWAFTLLVLIGTRASKLELHNGLGYLQQTLRRRVDVEKAAPTIEEQERVIQAMQHPSQGEVEIPPKPPTPLKRHGVGRWGR